MWSSSLSIVIEAVVDADGDIWDEEEDDDDGDDDGGWMIWVWNMDCKKDCILREEWMFCVNMVTTGPFWMRERCIFLIDYCGDR